MERADAADKEAVRELYFALLDGWNQRSAEAMAAVCTEDAELIGFDGSQHVGREEIVSTLGRVFADHPTPLYVAKVRSVRLLGSDVAVLRGVAGMTRRGEKELLAQLNAIQSVVAVRREGEWRVALFQNTPAQFHGRPELVEALTQELRELL